MDATILFMFAIFGVLLVLEVPIAFALAGSALLFLTLYPTVPLTIVVQRMAPGIESFPLLAIPLFILAGQLLNSAGIAHRIFRFAHALVGHIRGGLAHCNIVASIIFSAMSGVAQADAAGLGTVEVKAMRDRGFDPAFAAAVSAASAIIGPIIPPSVIMVIYGLLAQVSVQDLFLAGILPGLLMGFSLMATVYYLAATGRVVAPVEPRATWPELRRLVSRGPARIHGPGDPDRGPDDGSCDADRARRAHGRLRRLPRLLVSRARLAQVVRGHQRDADLLRRPGVHYRGRGAVRMANLSQSASGIAG